MAPLCPCVNYASESGYYKNIYFKKVFDALHTNHVKWSYKFVALLELDLPYNGEACETKIDAFDSRYIRNKYALFMPRD